MPSHYGGRESYLNASPGPSRRKPACHTAYDSRWGRRAFTNGSDVSETDDESHQRDHAYEGGFSASEAMLPQVQPLRMSDLEHLHQTTLPRIIDAYERRYARLAEIRFNDAVRRMEAHYQWNGFRQDLSNLQESARCLLAKSTASKSDDITKKPKARFKKLHTRMQSDLESLSTKIQAVDELMSELRARDRRIERAEQALDNASQALISAVRTHDVTDREPHINGDDVSAMSLAPTSKFESEVSAVASPQMAPQMLRFYEAVRTYKMMRERLFDLDVERQEQGDRRLLLAEQDQTPDQTDEEFNAAWEQAFVVPEQDFRSARMALQNARQLCIEAGIDVPALEDLQIPNTEGELEPRNSATKRPTSAALGTAPESIASLPPVMTLVRSTAGKKLFGEPPEANELSSPPVSELRRRRDDSSPATPSDISDNAVERINQWMDNVDLHAVNQSLVKYKSSSRSGPPSAVTALTDKHKGRTHGIGHGSLLELSGSGLSGRKRATSLPQRLELGSDRRSRPADDNASLAFKPP